MNIEFDNKKTCECYRNLVENPVEPKYIRKFAKEFGEPLIPSAIKLHERLKSFNNVLEYNKVYFSTDNRIEIKKGLADKDRFILKVRVQGAFRKFFCHKVNGGLLIKKNWNGDFESVTDIYVIDVNKHDYNSVR